MVALRASDFKDGPHHSITDLANLRDRLIIVPADAAGNKWVGHCQCDGPVYLRISRASALWPEKGTPLTIAGSHSARSG
jgi:transketolase C-terminal domain/subunit